MPEAGNSLIFGILLTAGLGALLLSVVVWRGRAASQYCGVLTIVLLAVAEILIAYAFSFADSLSFEQHVAAITATYIGWLVGTVALVLYVSRLTGRDHWIRPWVKVIAVVVPCFFAVIIFGPWSISLFFGGGFDPVTFAFPRTSPIYIAFYVWTYALNTIAVGITVRSALTSQRLHRYQVILVLVAITLPWVLSSLSFFNIRIFGIGPAVLSLIPVTFAVFAMGTFRAFDLRPLSEAESYFASDTGVVVLDDRSRVSAMNASAVRLLGPGRSPAMGRQVEEVWSHRPDIVATLRGAAMGDVPILSASGERLLHFESVTMVSPSGQATGTLVLIRAEHDEERVDA